jgi:glycosyltransferase involved in cell wall biosynthesis
MKRRTNRKRKLHWVCESPSSYNDFLFRALARSQSFELMVHYRSAFNKHYECRLGREPGYSAREYETRFLDTALLTDVLRDPNSLFLTSCWQDLTCQLILLALLAIGRPYLIWNDAPSPRLRGRLKEKLRSTFLKTVFRGSLKVLGTGRMALGIFTEMGAPLAKLVNFPFCVNLKTFAIGAYPRREGHRPVFGTCARLEQVKGIDVALRALARCNIGPFLYRIAGAGNEEVYLRELAGRLGLRDSVEFCGWLQPDNLPNFYQQLDVYLHPALFEPYGVAVVEALACGVPILASDKTGSAIELINPGNGQLHRAGDSDDLLRTIEAFLPRISGEGEQLRVCARQAAGAWTVDHAVETIEQIVDGLQSTAPDAASVRVNEGI